MYNCPKHNLSTSLPPLPTLLMIEKSLQSFCTPLGFYYELQLAFYYTPLEVLVTSKF